MICPGAIFQFPLSSEIFSHRHSKDSSYLLSSLELYMDLHCRSASSSHFQPSACSSWPSFQLPLPLLVWDHTWYTLGWFGVFFLCCFYALISPVPSLFHLTGMAFLILPFSPVGTFHLSLSILKIHTVIMLLWYLMRTVNTSECDCVACSLVFTWCKIMQ